MNCHILNRAYSAIEPKLTGCIRIQSHVSASMPAHQTVSSYVWLGVGKALQGTR